jgi:hypothetical protein
MGRARLAPVGLESVGSRCVDASKRSPEPQQVDQRMSKPGAVGLDRPAQHTKRMRERGAQRGAARSLHRQQAADLQGGEAGVAGEGGKLVGLATAVQSARVPRGSRRRSQYLGCLHCRRAGPLAPSARRHWKAQGAAMDTAPPPPGPSPGRATRRERDRGERAQHSDGGLNDVILGLLNSSLELIHLLRAVEGRETAALQRDPGSR